MELKYESIDFGNTIPIKFFVEEINMVKHHWHESLELIYILSGQMFVNEKKNRHLLKEDDILLIQPYDIHSFQGEQCVIASFHIQLHLFDKNLLDGKALTFDCNSSKEHDKSRYFPLRKQLALFVKANIEPTNHTPLLNKSYVYALIYELVTTFSTENVISTPKESSGISRMERILEYINIHYQEKLSLQDVAQQMYLTIPYLSRIFKQFMGVNFSTYLAQVRLSHAIYDLIGSTDSIERIASQNGFPNTRSFVSAFRQEYNSLPSDYRKKRVVASTPTNYRTFVQHNHLKKLAQYLEYEQNPSTVQSLQSEKIVLPSVQITTQGQPLKHTFKQLISIGKAKHLLFAENQKILTELQNEIGFHYIKFHGLLDDDMMLYSENAQGNPELSFTYLDMIIDFLLSINLKPFLQLSFMPKALAKTPTRTMFYQESIISIPKSMKKWTYLITQLILHLKDRYGLDNLLQWPFYLWNEPDSPLSMFGFEDDKAYFSFYKETYRSIKLINPDFLVGSSSFMYTTLADGLWIDSYLSYCKKHHCTPDFLNFHFYPVRLEENKEINLQQHAHLVLARSENELRLQILQIKKNSDERNWNISKLFLTEWNSSVSHRDLLNDTAFKSAYLVKNILENYDSLESFGYWASTDFMEEVKMSNQLFHGGLGLFTINGIKKPHFYAYTLLNKLGSHMIERGDGYFITKEKNCFQVLFYNYQHYSSLYASGELFDMTFTNRYTPFSNPKIKCFSLPLQGFINQEYLLRETILNQSHGSAFDKWVELGALPLETAEEVRYLKSISVPKILKRKITISNHILMLTPELMPHEVRLVEIFPIT